MFTPADIGVVKKLGAGMTDTFIVSLKEDVHASDSPQLRKPAGITNLRPVGDIFCTLLDTTGRALSSTGST